MNGLSFFSPVKPVMPAITMNVPRFQGTSAVGGTDSFSSLISNITQALNAWAPRPEDMQDIPRMRVNPDTRKLEIDDSPVDFGNEWNACFGTGHGGRDVEVEFSRPLNVRAIEMPPVRVVAFLNQSAFEIHDNDGGIFKLRSEDPGFEELQQAFNAAFARAEGIVKPSLSPSFGH